MTARHHQIVMERVAGVGLPPNAEKILLYMAIRLRSGSTIYSEGVDGLHLAMGYVESTASAKNARTRALGHLKRLGLIDLVGGGYPGRNAEYVLLLLDSCWRWDPVSRRGGCQ